MKLLTFILLCCTPVLGASAQSLGEALKYLYPTADQFAGDYRVEERADGQGPRIVKWDAAKLGAQPTQAQIDQARIDLAASRQAAKDSAKQEKALLQSAFDKLIANQPLTQAELNAILLRLIQRSLARD